jgi:hypothetical protein
MRHRPGVMAPPTLYDEPPCEGLMTPAEATPPFEVDLRALLWVVAVVLGALELCLELAPG